MKKKRTITRTAVYMIIGQALMLVGACLLVSYVFFSRTLEHLYEEYDRSVSRVALAAVDQKDLELLAEQTYAAVTEMEDPYGLYKSDPDTYFAKLKPIEDSEVYQNVRSAINEVRRETSSTAICYSILFPEDNRGLYIFDSSDYNVLPCGEWYDIDLSNFRNDPEATFEAFVGDSPTYGKVRTNGPVVYENGNGIIAVLLSDVPISYILEKGQGFLFQTGAVALILTAIICAGVAALLQKYLTRPMKEVSETAQKFVGSFENRSGVYDETHVFESVDGGEIRELCDLRDSMEKMENEMNSYLKKMETMAADRARISTELDLAEKIQMNMLPNIFPAFPERPEFDIFAVMNPAKEVGGDFYDFFLLDDDHLGIVMADVSGKGIPGALFMMMSKILVANAAQMGMTPAGVLSTVNNAIYRNNENDMFVTVWFGIMTISTGHVIASNGGHEYPVIKGRDGAFELYKDVHGFVLGGMEDMEYQDYEFDIEEGGALFLYTDGLPEATDSDGKPFGLDRMITTLNKDTAAKPREMIEKMMHAVNEFVGEAPQFDDLTMLAIRRPVLPKDDSRQA